ncbi:MAG: hypothetical protein PQJ49_02130 [Sphaerochaetaceae bacterium]|nr:hypothetical protein [Sphaerochaetaceae bacterium]MDC7248701.1 hypothetical protein [Sphaerochaetaceae bacterium]
MKKTFLICIYFIIISNIYCTTYKSNSIGQKLSIYNGEGKYYLIEKVNNSKIVEELYKDDILIQTKTIQDDGYVKIETIDDLNSKTILTYEENKLISEINDEEKITYYYDDNLLESKFIYNSDGNKTIYLYFYDVNNLLSAIKKITPNKNTFSTYQTSEDYQSLTISDNKFFKQSKVHNGIINSSEYEADDLINNIEIQTINEDDILLIEKKDNFTNKEYYKDGILKKQEIYNENDFLIKSQEYIYDENYIKIKEIITEKIFNKLSESYDKVKTQEIIYKKGNVYSVLTKENEKLTSYYYFNDNNQKIENLYSNNKVYCTITYENDKIIDIQYREDDDDL